MVSNPLQFIITLLPSPVYFLFVNGLLIRISSTQKFFLNLPEQIDSFPKIFMIFTPYSLPSKFCYIDVLLKICFVHIDHYEYRTSYIRILTAPIDTKFHKIRIFTKKVYLIHILAVYDFHIFPFLFIYFFILIILLDVLKFSMIRSNVLLMVRLLLNHFCFQSHISFVGPSDNLHCCSISNISN